MIRAVPSRRDRPEEPKRRAPAARGGDYRAGPTGLTSQMSRAYSAIVRSVENFPMPATLRIAFAVQTDGSR